jgi:photosystem II stability/assembly factor-like uncharacterized protein
MRTPFLLAAAMSCGAFACLAQSNTPCWVKDIAVRGNQAWVICQEGEFFHTPNGGSSWSEVGRIREEKPFGLAMLDEKRGFVTGDNGLLMATADGGRSWKRLAVPAKEHLRGIQFVGNQGWIAGWSGVILHTNDGGATWGKQISGTFQSLDALYFADELHGWAAGWVGTILRTTDGGKTWENASVGGAIWSLSGIHFVDRNRGWAVGFGGLILHSEDGGKTWKEQKSPLNVRLEAVRADAQGRVWIACDNGLLVTTDGGNTWRGVMQGSSPLFLERLALGPGGLWAVGPFNALKQEGDSEKWSPLSSQAGQTLVSGTR